MNMSTGYIPYITITSMALWIIQNIDKAIKEVKITTVWKVTYTAELR